MRAGTGSLSSNHFGRYNFRLTRYLLCILVIGLLSCKQDNSLDPKLFIPSSSDLAQDFDFEFCTSDTIRIYALESANYHEPYFQSIIIGFIDDDVQFIPRDTLVLDYSRTDAGYHINFSYLMDISEQKDSSKVKPVKISMQFIIDPTDLRTLTFDIDTYRYPYESATIFMRKLHIPGLEVQYSSISDYAIAGPMVYLLTYNNYGIYSYRMTDKNIIHVTDSYHSNFCIYYDGYLYIDTHSPYPISRFNLSTNEFDQGFEIENYASGLIQGMDIYQNILYVHFYVNSEDLLLSYNLNGDLINTIQFPANSAIGWGMNIHNDVIYNMYWKNDSDNNTYTEIRRTSLQDLAPLPALLSPAGDLDVIEIENDNLYYILYYSQTICYVPLSDLREIN